MIVVDASAVLAALLTGTGRAEVQQRLRSAGWLHAPHLIDAEVGNALRRLVRTNRLHADRAADALTDVRALPIRRYPHGPFLGRAWSLRENTTFSDALYVAVAETLDAPLLTCDARLARAPGIAASVELIPS